MTEQRGTDQLVTGLKKAVIHFSKAGIEIVAGVGDLAAGVARTVRPPADTTDGDADGRQKIEIE